MSTRKEIADRVMAKWRAEGFVIDEDAEFKALMRLWIAGDLSIDHVRRRYMKLLVERERNARA